MNSAQSKNTKVGRNDPCHCGSNVKYKKCCLTNNEVVSQNHLEEIKKDSIWTQKENASQNIG